MELSLANTLAKLKRCQQTPMPITWGDHLDLARCVAMIGEDDPREATTAMGRCLFHLQRDLLLETWREQLPTKQWVAFANEDPEASEMQTILQTQPERRPIEP